jgi:hypothetical protein
MIDSYDYQIGVAVGALRQQHPERITPTAYGNIMTRPDLALVYLRYLPTSALAMIAMVPKPVDWRPSLQGQNAFWLGYYHGYYKGVAQCAQP